MNYSRAISFKVQGMYGGVVGNDKFVKSDPYHQAREYSFNATLIEGSGQIEYNFLNFRTSSSRIVKNWTPYVFGGYGATLIESKSLFKTDKDPTVFTPFSSNKTEQVIILGWAMELGC
jgi:Domain of unknown function (DUF6089)